MASVQMTTQKCILIRLSDDSKSTLNITLWDLINEEVLFK